MEPTRAPTKRRRTEIVLHRSELGPFDLPEVCVLTGGRDEVRFRDVRFLYTPPVAYLGIFLGLLPFFIFARILQKRAKGSLPMGEIAFQRLERSRRTRAAASVALAIAFFFEIAALVSQAETIVVALGGIAMIASLIFLVVARDKGPRCRTIDGDYITLDLPSVAAVDAIEAFLGGATVAPPPADARCPRHVESMASGVCRRCGDFYCPACAWYARSTAPAFCPACFERRAAQLDTSAASEQLAGPNLGFTLGVLSLVPGCWIVQAGGFVTSLVVLLGLRQKGQIAGRRRALAGLVLSTLGGAVSLYLMVIGALDSNAP